ncbi:MAG: twin-arginine translocation signal domain-containing protein [Chloroflexi bacterium]|nr:MAG: twin-arginine translocation signal domain-containing protein [Chloroflexota bacterium]
MKQRVMPSLSDLLDRLTQLEDRTSKAEERAARAEARAAQLENATGNLAAAVVDPRPMSRRSLLTKVAAAGAVGVAGSLILAKPKDVFASFTWTGGALNAADAETTVQANAGFAAGAVLRLDANQGVNGATNIDGVQAVGTNVFSGVAGFGGNNAGTGLFGIGGPATGTGVSGSGVRGYAGTSAAGQRTWASVQGYQQNQQNSAYTYNAIFGAAGSAAHNSNSNGVYSYAADHGFAIWGDGGGGNGATPPTNGGVGIYANSGPSSIGLIGYGDVYSYNPALGSHGVAGFGNALGVGGWFTGGRAHLALSPTGAAGPPTTLQHFRGDVVVDVNEVLWVCIGNGTPGTWSPIQPGGWNNALFTAVSTSQYQLVSDGVSWIDMDAANLKLTITPTFECQAVLSASADLWTSFAGLNQDIGISVSGGVYPTTAGQPEGWKESGGFAGTFSPNAAGVQAIVPLAAGIAYTVKIVWKTNKPASGHTIAAGAGPISGKFSPTRLTANLVATNVGGTRPLAPAKPYEIPAEAKPPAEQKRGVLPKVGEV